MPTPKSEIEFNRPKKYRTLRVLGHGACGETVLIRDDDMGVDLVVKKYRPSFGITHSEPEFSELMERFREEARILFQLNHPNIVRVYNFFDYKEHETAYIIMEHIEGTDIETHVKNNPLNFDSIFEKVIGGFEHLESKGILHRDIRPLNLLVSNRGEPKIIDFGFGKQIDISTRAPGKSISLNWWCETPPEFQYSVYDTQTEVYFVGKLFEHVMVTNSLDGSKHAPTISRMCAPPRDVRFKNFRDIYSNLNKFLLDEKQFSESEISVYRMFSNSLASIFSEMGADAAYNRDVSKIIGRLKDLYNGVMLEEYLPSTAALCRIFVGGSYTYYPGKPVPVKTLKNFLDLLLNLGGQKQEIVVANIFSKLDGIPRAHSTQNLDDEIPF